MRMRTLLLIAAIAAPTGLSAQSTDLFEISFSQNGTHGTVTDVIRLEADQLDVVQCCSITVRDGTDVVAAFQSHQISLVVNRSAGGERVFEVRLQSGETLEVRADRMSPQQSGLIHFYTDGRLVGLTNQNAARMVIDTSARTDRRLRRVLDQNQQPQ